ncbi:50S ribosomal protein L3 [Candidatus Woesearchaeota archaeon]|nr:50S ribosomal protein L3P [uncultured archaeon]MBS3122740.1 50S ribosomal protein L3 [Candidatus Woesearchaeota archaeon]
MGQPHKSRAGSMQFWPRKQAIRIYPRVRSWPIVAQATPLGFAGYKVGMTHTIIIDNKKTSKTKGEELFCPVTVVECPPLKILSVRFYKYDVNKWVLKKEIMFNADKELGRKLSLPKTQISAQESQEKLNSIAITDYDDVRINVYTQPKLAGVSKKKPEVFELALGGPNEEKLKYVQEHVGKEIRVSEVFKSGQLLDVHGVTKGKGYQGPVKRFGVMIRQHKAEKTKRGPGSLGAWRGQGHMMYRVAHAGRMGFHTRTEYNKWLLKISDKVDEINPKGGFLSYGLVKSDYVLIKGSLSGHKKRLLRFNFPSRTTGNKSPQEAPAIDYIHLDSSQGK